MVSTQAGIRVESPVRTGEPMRVLLLLLMCVALAACAGNRMSGETPADMAAAPPPAGAPAAPAPRAPRTAQDATEAKVICWGKVEREKRIKSIDQRIAFVDKCVAEQMRAN
jgi:hypothetical protein